MKRKFYLYLYIWVNSYWRYEWNDYFHICNFLL